MKKITQLKKEEQKIRAKINKIEDEEVRKFQIPRLKKMVGQCFIYRKNCYSCPEKPSDYWSIFKKIIDWVDSKEKEFYFIVEEFSIDREGKVTWEIDKDHPYTNREWWDVEVPFSGYEKITEKEYNAAKIKMIEERGTQTKMRKVLNSKWD